MSESDYVEGEPDAIENIDVQDVKSIVQDINDINRSMLDQIEAQTGELQVIEGRVENTVVESKQAGE